ncbi:MAG: hypothetical protein ACRC33_13525 [Gemmataceae bacterium]
MTTRLMSLGLMAALALTLAVPAADEEDKEATKEQRALAEARAKAIDLIVEGEKLEETGERLKAPALVVMAGAMYLSANKSIKNFSEVKAGPEGAQAGEKAEEGLSLTERAAQAFAAARKLSKKDKTVEALIKDAEAGKLLEATRGNASGPYRQVRTVPAKGRHTFKFDFNRGQLALVGFAAQGSHLKFHIKHPRLGQVGMIYDRGGTWREVVNGKTRMAVNVVIENPHGRPVTYAVYTN